MRSGDKPEAQAALSALGDSDPTDWQPDDAPGRVRPSDKRQNMVMPHPASSKRPKKSPKTLKGLDPRMSKTMTGVGVGEPVKRLVGEPTDPGIRRELIDDALAGDGLDDDPDTDEIVDELVEEEPDDQKKTIPRISSPTQEPSSAPQQSIEDDIATPPDGSPSVEATPRAGSYAGLVGQAYAPGTLPQDMDPEAMERQEGEAYAPGSLPGESPPPPEASWPGQDDPPASSSPWSDSDRPIDKSLLPSAHAPSSEPPLAEAAPPEDGKSPLPRLAVILAAVTILGFAFYFVFSAGEPYRDPGPELRGGTPPHALPAMAETVTVDPEPVRQSPVRQSPGAHGPPAAAGPTATTNPSAATDAPPNANPPTTASPQPFAPAPPAPTIRKTAPKPPSDDWI